MARPQRGPWKQEPRDEGWAIDELPPQEVMSIYEQQRLAQVTAWVDGLAAARIMSVTNLA